jgi:hypothetical protein
LAWYVLEGHPANRMSESGYTERLRLLPLRSV